jgi:exonuclease SbcC
MEVTLVNFRFHRNATFKIPDSGMILLKGEGGRGKSTILNAIYFALYGVCRKPYSHGAKTCKVTLKYPSYGLKITRTKTPNRLLVVHENTEYEDDNAQGVVDKVMNMTSLEFYASSYFDQFKKSSILSMSPSEQLSFIEIIAFENKNHEDFKNKIKDHVKSLEKERGDINSQISLIQSQILSCEMRLSELKNKNDESDDITLNPATIKQEIEEFTITLENLRKDLKSKRAELHSASKIETANRDLEDEKLRLETQIGLLKESITNLGDIKSEDDIKVLADHHSKLQQTLQYIQDSLKVNELQEEFTRLSTIHFETLSKKIEELKKKIIPEDHLAKIKESLEHYEKFKSKFDEEERLREQLEKDKKEAVLTLHKNHKFLIEGYKTDELFAKVLKSKKPDWDILRNVMQKKIGIMSEKITDCENTLKDLECELLACPKCKANLQLKNDEGGASLKCLKSDLKTLESMREDIPSLKLELSSIKMERNNLEKRLVSVEKSLETIKSAQVELSVVVISTEEYKGSAIKIAEQTDLVPQLEKLETSLKLKNLPTSLNKLKTQISDKKKGIPKNLEMQNVEELLAKIKEANKIVESAWMIKGNFSKHSRDLSGLEKKLKSLSSRFLKSTINPQKIRDEIVVIEKEIETSTSNVLELNKLLYSTESHLSIQHTTTELENLKKIEIELNDKCRNINNRIEGAEGLEKAAIEAEFLALEKTIDSINEHAKIYLTKLFPTPITARLQVKRTTKKGDASIRPNINMYVEYQGEVYDDIDEFSGSERQRCDIAFLFGVNDMMGSNILMLDECFTNLHEDQQSEMLDCIHEITHENPNKIKQVIIIAPRVIEGVFDHIIDIDYKDV